MKITNVDDSIPHCTTLHDFISRTPWLLRPSSSLFTAVVPTFSKGLVWIHPPPCFPMWVYRPNSKDSRNLNFCVGCFELISKFFATAYKLDKKYVIFAIFFVEPIFA